MMTVYLFVCLRAYLRNYQYMSPTFCAYRRPIAVAPLAALRYVMHFGFMGDVILTHSGQRVTSLRRHAQAAVPLLRRIGCVATYGDIVYIGANSTGETGNFAPVLTQEPGQTLRFAPVPFMAVL